MYVVKLALKRLASRPGNSLLSIVLFAVGIGIISLITLAGKQMNKSIRDNIAGIDLVIGAKGSPLQLILSSVLHADYPTGNISLHEAEMIAHNPMVSSYIPIALGDSYRGYRIVGAPLEYPGIYNAKLMEGVWFHEVLEAAIGYNVARNTGLGIGDTFYGIHGFQHVGHAHDEFVYTVTGILEPTTMIVDNLILTSIESVWKVHESHSHDHDEEDDHHHDHDSDHDDHDHEHHHHHEHHDHHDHVTDQVHGEQSEFETIREKIEAGEDISREEMELYQQHMQQTVLLPSEESDREITAMLLFYRSPAAAIQLPRMVNESTNMQAASPAIEVNRLFKLLAFGFDALRILAWVIILISGINLFVNLWNTLRQGLSEIALMRVLGAGQSSVFLVLMAQGIIIAISGWFAGILLSRAIWLLLPSFHFLPETWFALPDTDELLLLVYSILAGFMASLLPAIKAYRTDVHYTLTRSSHD
jgi:putative ABC transport system permease protein